MIYRNAPATATQKIAIGLSLLVISCAAAQTNMPAPSAPFTHSVSLITGSCPGVHAGDSIAVDWNPGFDPSWAVTGIRDVAMDFVGLTDAGIVNPRSHFHISRSSDHRLTSIGNGYFHVEVQVPSKAAPGTYQLAEAYANALTRPEYQGEPPHITVSPAREHLCITVLPSTHSRERSRASLNPVP